MHRSILRALYAGRSGKGAPDTGTNHLGFRLVKDAPRACPSVANSAPNNNVNGLTGMYGNVVRMQTQFACRSVKKMMKMRNQKRRIGISLNLSTYYCALSI